MEKIKLNYSILVSIKIDKETILEICHAGSLFIDE